MSVKTIFSDPGYYPPITYDNWIGIAEPSFCMIQSVDNATISPGVANEVITFQDSAVSINNGNIFNHDNGQDDVEILIPGTYKVEIYLNYQLAGSSTATITAFATGTSSTISENNPLNSGGSDQAAVKVALVNIIEPNDRMLFTATVGGSGSGLTINGANTCILITKL